MPKINIKKEWYKDLSVFIKEKDYKTCPAVGGGNPSELGVFPEAQRIIAIGDIHGDFSALIKSLEKAKLIDYKGNWTGKNTFVVQLGDLLDRGGRGSSIETDNIREELDILQFLEHLNKQAISAGGNVIALIGNHELMNVAGNFNYTTENTNLGWGGENNRQQLFKPGGPLAKHLGCNCLGICKVGKWVFVHGGLLPHHLRSHGISDINKLVKDILFGNVTKDDLSSDDYNLIYGNEGIFWVRALSGDKPDCKSALKTMQIINSGQEGGGIVVGHTPQTNINSVCSGKVWLTDNGMSQAFGERDNDSRIQVLEIRSGKKPRVIY